MALPSPRGSGPETCRLADGSGTPSRGTAGARQAGGRHHWADWLLASLSVAPGAPAWVRGLRLAAAMIVPLAVGVIAGAPAAGLLVGVGAFVVASTDTGGPYRPRAATMVTATLAVTAAYFTGALTAGPRWLSVLLFTSVLAGSALIGTVGPRVALVSTMVTVAFVIGAFLPSSLAADAGAALALLAGGGWALGLSLAGWPFDRWRPERRAVRALIAVVVGSGHDPVSVPPGASGHQWRAVLRAVRHPETAVLRGAVRQAVAGGIALVVASLFDPAHGAWLVSSTVLVLKPNLSGTLSTAAQRAVATVTGAMIAAGIVAVTSNQATLIAISFAVAALAMAVMPLSYILGMLIITPLSILLTTVLTGSGWLIAVSRVENILIGVAIAALASCLLFPTWLRTSVPGLVASAIEAIGRYLALVREPGRGAGAQARLLHEARSDAETAVASLRAAAGQLGLEPGSGAVAMAGDVSAAAARVLDVIIALQVMLDQPGSGRPAGVTAIMGEAGDALRRMRAALVGQERPVPVAVLAGTGRRQGQAGALTTAAAPARATIAAAVTRAGSRGESSPCAPVPGSALLSAALDQLTDAVADLGSALGRLPPAPASLNQQLHEALPGNIADI